MEFSIIQPITSIIIGCNFLNKSQNEFRYLKKYEWIVFFQIQTKYNLYSK